MGAMPRRRGLDCSVLWGFSVLALLGLSLPGQIGAETPSGYAGAEGEWSDMFGRSGTDDPVHTFAVFDSLLIVGGTFKRAAHTDVNYVAGWDGSVWIPLGDPGWEPTGAEGPVHIYDLAVYDSALIACGRLRGTADDLIARWNGESWTPLAYLADPANNLAAALTIYQEDLIVAGYFGLYDHVARFDGASWQPLGDGVNEKVLDLAVYGCKLIAAGEFTKAENAAASHIAQWDGDSWAPLGEGLNGTVHALAVHNGCLVAGGDFPGYVAAWNDTSWSSLDEAFAANIGEGIPGPVHALSSCFDAINGSWLDVGGGSDTSGFVVRVVAGEPMETLSQGFNFKVEALAHDGTSVFAGGSFTRVNDIGAYHVARFDSQAWSVLGQPSHGLDHDVEVLAAYGDNLIVATWPGKIMSWDGVSWEVLAGDVNGHVYDLIAYDGGLIVGGDFTEFDGESIRYLGRWDGSSWSELSSGVNGRVLSLGVYESDLIVGGSFSAAGGQAVRNLASWDGTFWYDVGGGKAHPVDHLVEWDGRLILSVRNTIQAWDGRFWNILGTTYGTIEALTADESGLIVAGDFSEFDGVSARRVARWDGDSWSGFGSGLDGGEGVFDVVLYNGNLVAAGSLSEPCSNIARWNGFVWQCMERTDSPINGLAVWGGHLAAGGMFTQADTLSSYHIALWDDYVDPVMHFSAEGRDEEIYLSWTAPPDACFRGTLIRYSTEAFPTEPVGGQPLPNGNDGRFDGTPGEDTAFVHSGLPSDVAYYYTAFTYDEPNHFSAAAYASDATLDKIAPDTATNFIATVGQIYIQLGWTNPLNEDFRGTLIRYSNEGFPAGPTAGEPLPNGLDGYFDAQGGSNGAFTHSGVEVATTYYYSAFTYDMDFNYSSPVGTHALVPDESPPGLELGILQNPYLTQYLDVYLISSEALDSASVFIKVASDTLDARAVDSDGTVWEGDHELTGTGSAVIVYASATDTSGNINDVATEFSSAFVLHDKPNDIVSYDGRVRVHLEPNALGQDAYVIIVQGDEDDPGVLGTAGAVGEGVGTGCVGRGERCGSYYWISPSGIPNGPKATIGFTYDNSDLASAGSPDRFYIEQGGVGPLDCYVDVDRQTVSARIAGFGVFHLALGMPGSSCIEDPGYLKVDACHPNPFCARTAIRLEIRASQRVRATVYDAEGRQVTRFFDRVLSPGIERIVWDGTAGSGQKVPSGVYFVKVETQRRQHTAKLLLIR